VLAAKSADLCLTAVRAPKGGDLPLAFPPKCWVCLRITFRERPFVQALSPLLCHLAK
jgi:hypothetical protein